jgi:hypothetical protein
MGSALPKDDLRRFPIEVASTALPCGFPEGVEVMVGGEEFQGRMRGWVKQIHCPTMMQFCCLWAGGCVKKTAVRYALSKTFPGYVRGTADPSAALLMTKRRVGVSNRNWFEGSQVSKARPGAPIDFSFDLLPRDEALAGFLFRDLSAFFPGLR